MVVRWCRAKHYKQNVDKVGASTEIVTNSCEVVGVD